MELDANLFIAYASIVTMACVPIYIGSYLSTHQKEIESMSTEDAMKFPLVGSAVLFGLYLAFKFFSKEYINLLLTGYFLFFGLLAVAGTLKHVVQLVIKDNAILIKKEFVPFWNKSKPINIELDRADLVSGTMATVVAIWYATTKHWVANNILGLSFSIQGISLLSLGSYKIGSILLGGLFFYDIFWVFGTDVMVTVAKSFDAPIKLLFPKNLFADVLQFSMLGLGDIVIPGVFIALLLRFDRSRGNKMPIYFTVTYIAYILGLLLTLFVMHHFRAAQPALLYLVPACVGSSFGLATVRNEIKQLLDYTEESPILVKEKEEEAKSEKKE
ncbi:hypothetical protein PROFUN_04149 [Planoprotostelium fungivorum]|uniref:Minor histocompatibility antigen H13 n=1 Tax=Planoprotostelium fungivorum TaxID=1890364 RepID=A0A2P6NJM2_9EUKA|nr:hypothetical protein PROFUN_04149 [Planoprotostelium fungivorum]